MRESKEENKMKIEAIKKFILFKRPEYEKEVVDEIAGLFLKDDFPLNKIKTMTQAIRFMDYVFSLSCN